MAQEDVKNVTWNMVKDAARTAYNKDKPKRLGYQAHHTGGKFINLWHDFMNEHPKWFGKNAPQLELVSSVDRNGSIWYNFKDAELKKTFREYHEKRAKWLLLTPEEHAIADAEEDAKIVVDNETRMIKDFKRSLDYYKYPVNPTATEESTFSILKPNVINEVIKEGHVFENGDEIVDGVRVPKSIVGEVKRMKAESEKRGVQYVKPFDPTSGIRDTFNAISDNYVDYMTEVTNKYISYNIINKQAIEWVSTHGANEMKAINDSTRAGIRQITQLGFQKGLTVKEQTKLIKEQVGLLPRHVIAVDNYRTQLEELGLPDNTISNKVANYIDQLITYRAETIAITENESAASMSHAMLNEGMLAEGIIAAGEYVQRWVTADDERLCDICNRLHNQTAPIGSWFPGIPYGEKAHPRCRCRVVLVKNPSYEAALDEIPTEEIAQDVIESAPIDVTDIVSAVKSFDQKYPDMTVDLEGMDPKLAKETYSTLDTVLSTITDPINIVSTVRTMAPGEGFFSVMPKGYAAAAGDEVQLNLGYYADRKVMASYTDNDVTYGFHPIGFSSNWVTTHEIGHTYFNVLKVKDATKAQAIYEVINTARLNGSLKKWGQYAASQADEAFAEIFAAIHTTDVATHPAFVKEIETILTAP